MPCYRPLKAYRGKIINPKTGKFPIVFNKKDGYIDQPVEVPCGRCIGCRLEYSRQWAIRCVHEAQTHEKNCFITLTYSDEHLPKDKSLDVTHFQKFMKRLRKKYGMGARYYHCGEYGEQFGRPHYHACLFNMDFSDKELFTINNGQKLYTSESLQQLWPFGFSTIGEVTFESAAYVARYILKKFKGNEEDKLQHYADVDPDTGEVTYRKPEYTTMSRRPGIARNWFEKYSNDVFPKDYFTLNGKKLKPPKFYSNIYEITNPEEMKQIKHKRIINNKNKLDNTPERLKVREEVQNLRLKKLIRTLT